MPKFNPDSSICLAISEFDRIKSKQYYEIVDTVSDDVRPDSSPDSQAETIISKQLGQIDKQTLTTLLEDTKKAHGVYEVSPDRVEHHWADWYADHMTGELAKQSITIDSKGAKNLLDEAAAAYPKYESEAKARGETPELWPAWYSQYFINKFNESSK